MVKAQWFVKNNGIWEASDIYTFRYISALWTEATHRDMQNAWTHMTVEEADERTTYVLQENNKWSCLEKGHCFIPFQEVI